MKVTQSLLATFGLLSLASAADRRWANGTVMTTEVCSATSLWAVEWHLIQSQIVTAYTTYCPGPTTVVANNVTYTVTSATTLTITNCPCTITSMVSVTPLPPGSPSTSVTPIAPAGSSTTSASPVLATGAAVALGSSFGALVLGGVAAVLL